MAGEWIPAEVTLTRKLEVLQIAKETGRSRFEVVGILIEFWSWAQSVAQSCDIFGTTLRDVADALGQPVEFFEAVARVGWVKETPEGIHLVNADWWIEKGAKARLLNTKRKRDARASQNGPENVTDERDKNGTEARPDKSRGDKSKDSPKGESKGGEASPPRKPVEPDDVAIPADMDTPEVREAVKDWVLYKRKRGQGYKDASYVESLLRQFSRAGPRAFASDVKRAIANNYQGLKIPDDNARPRTGPGQQFDSTKRDPSAGVF